MSLFTIYLIIINIITFTVFAIDKFAAIKHRRRIRVATLFGLSILGGSIGGLISMYLFRHKTRKKYFTIGIPMIIVIQILLWILFWR